MLQLLADLLRTAIGEMHDEPFYNYEAGLQSLLVTNLSKKRGYEVAFEYQLTNDRFPDIITLKVGQLAAMELKFFCDYRQMFNNEAAAMLYDLIIARDHLK